MVKLTETTYECQICKYTSLQISHHNTHLTRKSHKNKREIQKLKLEKESKESLVETYDTEDIEEILKKMEFVKIVKEKNVSPIGEWSEISNSETLRDTIHETHNFLRNHGAGYGMDALKTFNLLYGLKRIEDAGILKKTGLSERCKFSNLVQIANGEDKIDSNDKLSAIINLDIMKEIYENEKMRPYLFYIMPDLKASVYSELVKKINSISDVEQKTGEQLTGKIYEYFIGRDQTAISELGAYFTNRYIVNFIFEQLDIELEEDGSVPEMIDMFGGSGGFTIAYINYINQKYSDIDWDKNYTKIHHYDMNNDVVKSAALEYFCLTKNFPKSNFDKKNSFTDEFSDKKYKYIITNPPYGGDKSKKTPHQLKRDKIKKYIIEELKCDDLEDEYRFNISKQLEDIKKDEKLDKVRSDKQKVSMTNSSKRLKKFCKDYQIDVKKVNDKEAVSFIQLMEMLDIGGTTCAVLKEGVFFNSAYAHIRKVLIENFNVQRIISVPQDQFENTSTKTSIIIFSNTGKTEGIKFSEINLEKYKEDDFDIVDGIVKLVHDKDDINGVNEKFLTYATYKQLVENDYTLNHKKYNMIELKPGKGYELVKLEDICEFLPKSKRPASFGDEEGKFNFYTSSQKVKKCDTADYDKECLVLGTGGNSCLHYNKGKFSCSADTLLIIFKNYQTIFMYLTIQTFWENMLYVMNGSTIGHIGKEKINQIQIPVPKSKQKIEKWVNKISTPYNRKLELEKEKEKLEIKVREDIDKLLRENETEEVRLGDLCELQTGKFNSKDCKKEGLYPFYTGKENQPEGKSDNYCLDEKEYIIFLKDGGSGKGKYGKHIGLANVYFQKGKSGFTSHQLAFIPKKNISFLKYIYYILDINNNVLMDLAEYSTGLGTINQKTIKNFKITLPKNRKLLNSLNPLFGELDIIEEEIPKQEKLYQDLLNELKTEAIKE